MEVDGPVIIIGAARSGTKFLRDTLAMHSNFYAVPFDVNFIWRFQRSLDADDSLPPDLLTSSQIEYIRRALYRLSKVPAGGILLEKTVSNTLRVPFVEAVFPNARYIHLVRDGTEVALSAIRQWEEPIEKSRLLRKFFAMPWANFAYSFWFLKNSLSRRFFGHKSTDFVWGPRYPGISDDLISLPLAKICARQWRASVTMATIDLSRIESDRVFNLRYEDLVRDKNALEELLEWLKVDNKSAVLAAFEKTVIRGPTRPISAQEERLIELVHTEIDETLKKLGYDAR